MWFILDVMRKGGDHPRNAWVALLINRDPDTYRAGPMEERWLDLGKHKSRDDAWDCAGDLIATRH